jgi:hypothetical protein
MRVIMCKLSLFSADFSLLPFEVWNTCGCVLVLVHALQLTLLMPSHAEDPMSSFGHRHIIHLHCISKSALSTALSLS